MNEYIKSLEQEFSLIKNGFKEEEKRALVDYKNNDRDYIRKLAFLSYESSVYQVRMYGIFRFWYLSSDSDILTLMRDEVSKDDNWRIQEILAKAFNEYCRNTGYKSAIPVIDEWLRYDNSNTRRVVTERLRRWTSRPYFKESIRSNKKASTIKRGC